ncbi:MAG: hypothetical protein ACM3Q1_18945 [Bacteroidales bacterium]
MLQSFWIGTDFAKLMASLPLGNEAVKVLLEKQMSNIKALEEANQHAIDAFHGVFNRQNEILHGTIEELTRLALGGDGSGNTDLLARQAAITMNATQQTLQNLRQMSEQVAQASQKAQQAFSESFTGVLVGKE